MLLRTTYEKILNGLYLPLSERRNIRRFGETCNLTYLTIDHCLKNLEQAGVVKLLEVGRPKTILVGSAGGRWSSIAFFLNRKDVPKIDMQTNSNTPLTFIFRPVGLQVVKAIERRKFFIRSELVKELGLSHPTLTNCLKILEQKGAIRRIITNTNNYYIAEKTDGEFWQHFKNLTGEM